MTRVWTVRMSAGMRGLENPTVDTLDRFAKALRVEAAEFLLVLRAGEKAPPTLKRGRRPR